MLLKIYFKKIKFKKNLINKKYNEINLIPNSLSSTYKG